MLEYSTLRVIVTLPALKVWVICRHRPMMLCWRSSLCCCCCCSSSFYVKLETRHTYRDGCHSMLLVVNRMVLLVSAAFASLLFYLLIVDLLIGWLFDWLKGFKGKLRKNQNGRRRLSVIVQSLWRVSVSHTPCARDRLGMQSDFLITGMRINSKRLGATFWGVSYRWTVERAMTDL